MKAAYRKQYCLPEEIKLKDLPLPECHSNEIRIKVACTTVNRTDEAILRGKPWIMRLFIGLNQPKNPILGTDFAGTVDAVGSEVKDYQVGDRLFGFYDQGMGSQAEYLLANKKSPLCKIPNDISFEAAAASVEGGHYAFNFLNKIHLKAGDKVLLNGASGAIGSAMLQMLKQRKTVVTATCTAQTIERIKALGADRIINYCETDFTKDTDQYDFVFDAVGKSSFRACKGLLKSKGTYISSELGPKNENPFLALITPLLGGKKVAFPLPTDIPRSLKSLSKQLSEGSLKPLIEKSYPLDQISEAYRHMMSGEKEGSLILKVG